MKVKILKATVADKKVVKKGVVVELDDKEAKLLISLKKAEAHKADKPEKEEKEKK